MNDVELMKYELENKDEQIRQLKEIVNGTIREKGTLINELNKEGQKKKWNINTSSILTKLIQEAGRNCYSYASDLFILWQYRIASKIEDGSLETGTHVFAFRESGVDSIDWYKHHIMEERYYRAVWFLDIEVENNKIEMVLHK